MPGDTFHLIQPTGERLEGVLKDPAATVGQVLTVQSDKTIKAAPGGGSQPGALRILGPFPFAFNTANLLTGIAVGPSLSADDVIYDGGLIFTTDWNGTTPQVTVKAPNGDIILYGWDATNNSNPPWPTGAAFSPFLQPSYTATSFLQWSALAQNQTLPRREPSGGQCTLLVDDGGGGDPGATQGAGGLYLIVATPSLT